VAERHEAHDLLLVAAHAVGDVDEDAARGEALVAGCAECAALATDLRAIAHATAEVPPARRSRDFFIQPADAARLRPHGYRRIAAAFTAPQLRLARPLAGGLMMVGFAGLLVASLPGLSGSAVPATADQRLQSVASPAPGAEIQGQGGGDAPASLAPYPTDEAFAGASRAGAQASAPPVAAPTATTTVMTYGPSPLVLASVGLVTIGAGLFLLTLLRTAPRRS
jgi:hypothetical protein